MDQIFTSPCRIPRSPYARELSRIDPALFKPIPPALQSILPLLKAIYRQTKPREPEKTAPPLAPAGYNLAGAAKYLGMTQRKLREAVKNRRIACTRIDYRNFLSPKPI